MLAVLSCVSHTVSWFETNRVGLSLTQTASGAFLPRTSAHLTGCGVSGRLPGFLKNGMQVGPVPFFLNTTPPTPWAVPAVTTADTALFHGPAAIIFSCCTATIRLPSRLVRGLPSPFPAWPRHRRCWLCHCFYHLYSLLAFIANFSLTTAWVHAPPNVYKLVNNLLF